MNGAVHGIAGLGALLWANVHGAPGVEARKPAAHHAQPQARMVAPARPAGTSRPRPRVAVATKPALTERASDAPETAGVTPLPRAKPVSGEVVARRVILDDDERQAFRAGLRQVSALTGPGAPLPRARPAGGPDTGVAILTEDERPAIRADLKEVALRDPASVPLPKARPTAGQMAASDPFASYGGSKPASIDMLTAFLPPPEVQHISPDDDAACRARLDALGVSYKPDSGIQFASNSCTVVGPLKVSSLGAGMSIAPAATMNCRTTEALAKWMRDVVAPAAEKHLHAKPSGITQASAFVCRPVNNVAGAKLSEHATGNAVDVAAIGLQGQAPFAIHAWSDDQPDERDFQAEIRQGACELFTTVLGPGTNAEHATHFHLDLAQRRGGSRLCE